MIHLRVLASSASLVGLLLTGCEDPPADPVLLDIGDRTVARSWFEDYIREAMREQPPFARAELKAELLDQFIEEQLLLRAADEEGIEVTPEEVDALARTAGFMEVREEADSGAVTSPGMSPSRDLEVHLRVRKLIDEKILKDVQVDEEEIANYYEENRPYYKRQQAVNISQILVETEGEANQILRELQARPAAFEELAREHSRGPEADQGGRLGTFRRDELPAYFEDEVFSLREGKLSGVVKTDFGYHIFRVNQVRPARDLSLDEVRDAIRVELLREKSDEALASYLEALKERFPVRIHEEQLDFPYSGGSTESG